MASTFSGTAGGEPAVTGLRAAVNAVVGTLIGWIWIIGLDAAAKLLTDDAEPGDNGPGKSLLVSLSQTASSGAFCGEPSI